MREAIAGMLIGIILAVGAITGMNSGGSDQTFEPVVVTPTAIAAPSPSELICNPGWTETMRAVTHVDGAVENGNVGFISCDRTANGVKYVMTRTLGGKDRVILWSTGAEVNLSEVP